MKKMREITSFTNDGKDDLNNDWQYADKSELKATRKHSGNTQ